jgi:hypothetical protein
MTWQIGTTGGANWQVGTTSGAITFGISQAGDYRHGSSCVLQVVGANGAYSVKWSPTASAVDPDAVPLNILVQNLDGSGNGSVTVQAARGVVRYGETGYIYLVQGASVGGLAKTLLAEVGKQYVTLVAPLAEPSDPDGSPPVEGERVTAIPDLAAGDQLIWWNAQPSGTVDVFADGSFVSDGPVTSFSVEAHVARDTEASPEEPAYYTAPATQTINHGSVDLTADGVTTGAPVLGTPTLVNIAHSIAGNGIVAGVPVLGSPSIGQNHSLSANGVTTGAAFARSPTVNSPLVDYEQALNSESAKDIYFLFLDFANEPFRATSGTRNYDWGGQTWLGIGEIGGVSEVAEASDAAARPFVVTLSGTDTFITQPALSRTNYKGRKATLYRGFLNENETLVSTPIAVWTGRMDVASAVWDEGAASVQVQCEPLAARLLRPNISRYSDQDHQLRWPGDKFYEYLLQMEAKDANWGGQRIAPPRGGGGGGSGGERYNDPIWGGDRRQN